MASVGAVRGDGTSGFTRLIPHEHGAWGQLLLPMAAALAMGRPTLPAVQLAVAALCLFIAHEPLLVTLGHRGQRMQEQLGRTARAAFSIWVALALSQAALALLRAPPSLVLACAPAVALAALVAVLAARRDEKTTAGELLVAWALAAAALPVALAGGAEVRSALSALGVWCAAFTSATLAVRAVLTRARVKGHPKRAGNPGWLSAAIAVALLAFALALASAWQIRWAAAWALLPPVAVACYVGLGPVTARQLRPVGWTFVAASVVTLLVLVVGLR